MDVAPTFTGWAIVTETTNSQTHQIPQPIGVADGETVLALIANGDPSSGGDVELSADWTLLSVYEPDPDTHLWAYTATHSASLSYTYTSVRSRGFTAISAKTDAGTLNFLFSDFAYTGAGTAVNFDGVPTALASDATVVGYIETDRASNNVTAPAGWTKQIGSNGSGTSAQYYPHSFAAFTRDLPAGSTFAAGTGTSGGGRAWEVTLALSLTPAAVAPGAVTPSGADSSFAAGAPAISQGPAPDIESDTFDGPGLDPRWTFYDDLGDCAVTVTGGEAQISVPAGVTHDLGAAHKEAPRIAQYCRDEDLDVACTISAASGTVSNSLQGITATDASRDVSVFVEWGLYSGEYRMRVKTVDGSTSDTQVDLAIGSTVPIMLRLTRASDTWTASYSTNGGSTWVTPIGGTFSFAMTVARIALFQATSDGGSGSPAATSHFTSFANLAATPPQTVSVGGVVSSFAAGAPTLSVAGVTVAPAGATSAAVSGTPAVTPGPRSVTAGSAASGHAAGVPVVAAGLVNVTASGALSAFVAGAVQLTTGAVAVHPVGPASSAAAGTPSVGAGAVSVHPPATASTSAAGHPLLSIGAVTITPTSSASGHTPGTPVLITGHVGISPTGATSTATAGTPLVNAGGALIRTDGAASTSSAGTPTLTPGAVHIAATAATSALAAGTPTVTAAPPGAHTLLPAGGASTYAAGQPNLTTGTVAVQPPGVASTATFGIPALSELVALAVTATASAAAPGMPHLTAGPATITTIGAATVETSGLPHVTRGLAPGGHNISIIVGTPSTAWAAGHAATWWNTGTPDTPWTVGKATV